MALSLGVARGGVNDPKMKDARATILSACKANRKFFLNTMTTKDVVSMIQEGVMIGPASREAAEIGRKFTHRQMPW